MNLARKPVRRVVWAVDPFEQDLEFDSETLREIGEWVATNHIKLEPVYVVTPVSSTDILSTKKIVRAIRDFFTDRNIKTLEPKLLTNPSFSLASAAAHLLEYAEKSGAGLMVVSSHGRRGWPRMVFGSFAELLLNAARMPILFLNHKPRPKGATLKKALWATDFSKASRFAYDCFLESCNGISNEVVLFHDVSLPMEVRTYFSAYDAGIPPMDEILKQQEFWARENMTGWSDEAKLKGFRSAPYIDIRHGKVSSGLLAAGEESQAGLVVMGSEARSFSALIMGSWARDVFLDSRFPVWIYGPSFMEEAQSVSIEPAGEDLEERIKGMSDEEALKVVLHTIRDRLRSAEIKNLGLFQEIVREIGQAGI